MRTDQHVCMHINKLQRAIVRGRERVSQRGVSKLNSEQRCEYQGTA